MEKIKSVIRKLFRECRRLSDFFPIAVCLSITVTLAGYAVSMFILNNPVVKSFLHSLVYSESMYLFLENYASFIGIWIVILLVVAISPRNLPMLDAIKHSKRGNNIKGLIVGVVLGFCTNGFCVLMSVLTGDVKLAYYGFDFVVLLAFAIAVFIQSGAEELSDRFYLYQKLRRRYKHPAFAIIINSLAFALLHVGNPGFTLIAGIQIFFVGLIFSLMVYYYNNLWGAMSFHATWNYTQNIIFGLPNSGIVSEYSIFTLEAASARNGLFYNAAFGVEGSIGACLLLAALSAVIIFINRNKPECNDVWAESEARAIQEKQKAGKTDAELS